MDEHDIRVILEGGGGNGGQVIRTLLWLPGKLYGLAMRLRRSGYGNNWLQSHSAAVPVISIGNITAGGSGKTPLTALLANHLASRGKKPAILLRGYRQSDGGQSDEAVLYGALCPGVPVEVGSNRLAGAARAVAAGADVLLMDDGFQHLRLRRDVDIVLVDATSPWGGGNTIPGGLLREPPSALSQARAVIVTRSDQVEPALLHAMLERIRQLAPHSLVLTARHRPVRLHKLGGTALPLESLRDRKVAILSGIARPEAFEKTVAGLGAHIAATFRGSDHQHFTQQFVMQAVTKAKSLDAVLVTTEKDQAKNIIGVMADNKLVDNTTIQEMIWVLGIEQDVEGREALFALVDSVAGLGNSH